MQAGQLTHEHDGFQISFERHLPHPIEKVWDAITNPVKLKEWFTDIEMEFKEGGTIKIIFRDENKTASFAQILKIQPPDYFIFSWEGEVASWHLTAENENSTLLKFTHSKISENYAINVSAGFHSLLDHLASFLDGKPSYHEFGSEKKDPEQVKLQVFYHTKIDPKYAHLLKFKPVVVEKTVKSSLEKVWAAITSKEKMKHWYFNLDAFSPEVGFTFKFPGTGTKGEQYIHVCKVLEVIPLKRLSYSWEYENRPGYSIVVFELSPINEKVLVKLSHFGLETFPEHEDFARTSFQGGWNELIGNLLPAYVEKDE